MELLYISDVSKILKLCKSDTYKLIRSGLLRATKLGSMKVSTKELERFIDWSAGKDLSNLDNPKEILVLDKLNKVELPEPHDTITMSCNLISKVISIELTQYPPVDRINELIKIIKNIRSSLNDNTSELFNLQCDLEELVGD